MWLATGDGLYRWNESDGLQPVPEFAGKRVNAIHQTADGVLWAGTQADGLLRLTDGRWQPVTDSASGELLFNDIVVNGIDRNVRRQPVGGDLQRRSVAAARGPVGAVGRQARQPEGSVAQRRRQTSSGWAHARAWQATTARRGRTSAARCCPIRGCSPWRPAAMARSGSARWAGWRSIGRRRRRPGSRSKRST